MNQEFKAGPGYTRLSLTRIPVVNLRKMGKVCVPPFPMCKTVNGLKKGFNPGLHNYVVQAWHRALRAPLTRTDITRVSTARMEQVTSSYMLNRHTAQE